ncbi:transcription repressor OFP3-like [Carica papaya]|uniref:transcription repressor OFP3-like n=1 Tax=Carica papaya TaxID=3649 RepID=UPI000B8CABD7|nr:transcription repressor OFP3-like [Carica papaya]
MAKNTFKHKLSRVLPSLQLCRSKYPSTSIETPIRRPTHRLSPVNPKSVDIGYPNLPVPPPCTPEPHPSMITGRHASTTHCTSSGTYEDSLSTSESFCEILEIETARIRKEEMREVMKGSVAVVKRSSEPYEDFKKSMVEIILEKQLFGARELEELLRCFLSLNTTQYHGVIVEAFTDIWEVLNSDNPIKN